MCNARCGGLRPAGLGPAQPCMATRGATASAVRGLCHRTAVHGRQHLEAVPLPMKWPVTAPSIFLTIFHVRESITSIAGCRPWQVAVLFWLCSHATAVDAGSHWPARVPVHMVIWSHITPERLLVALAGKHVASVRVPDCLVLQPGPRLSLVSALADSAPTLTALYGLPLGELQESPGQGLAGFTRLRSLMLRRPDLPCVPPPALSATLLPASLQELTVRAADPEETSDYGVMPALVAFERLCHLHRISFGHHAIWKLRGWGHVEGLARPVATAAAPGGSHPSSSQSSLDMAQMCTLAVRCSSTHIKLSCYRPQISPLRAGTECCAGIVACILTLTATSCVRADAALLGPAGRAEIH